MPPVRCLAALDDGAKAEQAGLLRAEAAVSHESGALWQGAQPDAAYSPQEVIELTLRALQNNDDPKPHSGTALPRRIFERQIPPGRRAAARGSRPAPPELTAFFRSSQYGLLLEPACYSQWTFPSETCSLDDEEAWQEVKFETQAGTRGENTSARQARLVARARRQRLLGDRRHLMARLRGQLPPWHWSGGVA